MKGILLSVLVFALVQGVYGDPISKLTNATCIPEFPYFEISTVTLGETLKSKFTETFQEKNGLYYGNFTTECKVHDKLVTVEVTGLSTETAGIKNTSRDSLGRIEIKIDDSVVFTDTAFHLYSSTKTGQGRVNPKQFDYTEKYIISTDPAGFQYPKTLFIQRCLQGSCEIVHSINYEYR